MALRRGDDGSEFNRISGFNVISFDPPKPEPFAPTDDDPAPKSTDQDGFDWANGQQGEGAPTQ